MKMKHFIQIGIVCILVFAAYGSMAQTNESTPEKEPQNRDFTHAVLGEYGTATWCGYCKYAHGALKEIYNEGQYQFYYISLVTDKNTKASQRAINDYNAYGWPTVWFDGGYKVNVGAGSIPAAKAAYITSITASGNRAVEDVDIDLGVTWLGGTNMEIDVSVTNNEATTYGGRIRVYITEKVSSMGWLDTAGYPYTFPMLDYAFNEALSIPAGGSWSDTTTWDGAAHGFPSITENNIMIIAAAFNDEVHQGYSYPPSSNPFNAYYVDEAVGAEPGSGVNNPPEIPRYPYPSNEAVDVMVNEDLSWTGGDPDGDTVTYDIYFGTTTSPAKIASNHTSDTYDPGQMMNLTTYYWQIIAWDEHGESTIGPIWSFTTRANLPPNTPDIAGEQNGKAGTTYDYTFTALDPNNDDVFYYIDWGDNTPKEWIGPYTSGEEVIIAHTWTTKDTYILKAKVKDGSGEESDWGNLEIEMPYFFRFFDFSKFPLISFFLERLSIVYQFFFVQ